MSRDVNTNKLEQQVWDLAENVFALHTILQKEFTASGSIVAAGRIENNSIISKQIMESIQEDRGW